MSSAAEWLEAQAPASPPRLVETMRRAIEEAGHAGDLADDLGRAALLCLRTVLDQPPARPAAFDLLAADALLTHACEAAAECGPERFERFMLDFGPATISRLLPNERS